MINEEITTVIQELSCYDKYFPKSAVLKAINLGTTISTLLLEKIDDLVNRAETSVKAEEDFSLNDSEWQLLAISLFLLSYLRNKETFPYLIRICKLPENLLEDFLGDSKTEDLNRFLASTFNNDFSALDSIFADVNIDEYVRNAISECYMVLYRHEIISREKILSTFSKYFEICKDDDTWARTNLINCAQSIYATTLIAQVKEAIDAVGGNDFFVFPKKEDEIFAQYKDTWLEKLKQDEHLKMIDDPIKEMEWWNCWAENKEKFSVSMEDIRKIISNVPTSSKTTSIITNFALSKKKTGRNDPCPCGSGKKYKKCCLP